MSETPEFRKSLAVVIGIDRYGGGIPALRTAVNDARRVGELLAEGHGYTVRQMLDSDATLERLRALLLEELPAEVGPDDRVFVYFAGHGVAIDGDQGPNGYLLPQDARRDNAGTFLHMPVLHDALLALPCRHMLVVMDSCFSGAFRWSSLRDLEPLPDVIHQERFERYLRDPAWQVITSSAHDQTALDLLTTGSLGSRGESGGHSPFALSLFEALAGRGDLVPEGGDGVITATELYLYLEQRLQSETLALGLRQTPRLWPLRKHDKGEFIFLVPGRSPDLPPAPPLTFDNNPYMGLASYERADADLFFGRERVVLQLTAEVATRPLTVVLGASGSGKSSIVKAGVVPALEQAGWRIAGPLRPGASPLHALAEAMGADAPTPDAVAAAVAELCADTSYAGVVLVVDQFEELLTLTAQPELRHAALELLARLLDTHADRLHIVLTLRSDFESQFDRTVLAPWWGQARHVVSPPTRDELRAIIEGPAARRVFYFQPAALVDELIDAVVATPGGLPLLSFTLSEMYRCYVARLSDDRALTRADYAALGGVVGALRSRADAEYEALDDAHRATLRRIMLRMVVPERENLARRRVMRVELDYADPVENERVARVIARFTAARLLVEGTDARGEAYVEPAHDALVRAWGRLLAWIHEEDARATGLRFQHELARTAQEWEQADGRTGGGLLWRDTVRSGLLAATLKESTTLLNRRELAFAKRSVRRRRAIRNGLAALVALIVCAGAVATVLGVVAEGQRREAVVQRDEAVRQTLRAQSSQLNAQAVLALDGTGDASRALRLAAAALRLDSTNAAATHTLLRSLYGELFDYRGRRFARPSYREGNDAFVTAADGTPPEPGNIDDEHFIAAEGILNDHSFEFMGARSANGLFRGGMELERNAFVVRDAQGDEVDVIPGGWSYGDFTADGRYLVTGSLEGEVVLWEMPLSAEDFGVRRLVTLGGHTDAIFRADFSADETQIVTLSRDGGMRRWELMARPVQTERPGESATEAPAPERLRIVSRDGRYAVHRVERDTMVVVDVASGDTVARRALQSIYARLVDISADGARVYTDETNGVVVWDWRSKHMREVGSGYQLSYVVVSPGGWVGTHAINDVTQVWDPAGRELIAVQSPRGDMLSAIELRDDGRVLALHRTVNNQRVADVLPLDPADLLAAAWGGVDTLTFAERERWDVGEMPAAGLAAAQPASLFQLLVAGVRARFGRAQPDAALLDSVRSDRSRQFDRPEPSFRATADDAGTASAGGIGPQSAWEAADADRACDGVGLEFGVRARFCAASGTGLLDLLAKTAGVPIFLGGPHGGGTRLRLDAAADFGRYNPAFVRWAHQTLIPGVDAPTWRAVAAPIYARRLRTIARAYWLAWRAVEARPELVARIGAEYLRHPQPGRYIQDEMNFLYDEIAAAHGEEAAYIGYIAGGFWVRRNLDGSRGEFVTGLRKLLEAFDAEWLAER